MLVKKNDTDLMYYVDYSTIGVFQRCKELARLQIKERLSPRKERLPLTFGSAFHKGVEILGNTNDIELAKKAFVNHLLEMKSSMSIAIDAEGADRRSVERGLVLLEAYQERWRTSAKYSILRSATTNKPYTEVGFEMYFGEWVDGIPIILFGTIDAFLQDDNSGDVLIKETKTTTQSLTNFIKQVKPNVQLSIYDKASCEILKIEPKGILWDCIFISNRKPNMKGDMWAQNGVDLETDFARIITYRTQTDREEILFDLTHWISDYLTWYTKEDVKRWPRSAPTACNMFGECSFKDACNSNLNDMLMESLYVKNEWNPFDKMNSDKENITITMEKRF